MFKNFLCSFLLLTCLSSAGQTDFISIMKAGKTEFNKSDSQGFADAINLFSKAIQINPNNAEAYYFLGYAYSRLNQFYAENIYKANLTLTLKSSEAFEKSIQISPKYLGEIVILDPHSKITSEWGTLAFKYLFIDQFDSAIWALKEGRKRGGFGVFYIETLRLYADLCPQNSYFLMSGDNITFNMLYLQLIEKYRTDIKAVDNEMLGTKWYPKVLKKYFSSLNDIQNLDLDSCCNHFHFPDSIKITDDIITTIDFEDTANRLITRSNCILFHMLNSSGQKNSIFFCDGYGKEPIGLQSYTKDYHGLRTLDNYLPVFDNEKQLMLFKKFLKCELLVNQNNRNEVEAFNNIRLNILSAAAMHLMHDDKSTAMTLFKLVEKNIQSKTTPTYEAFDEYFLQVKTYIEQ